MYHYKVLVTWKGVQIQRATKPQYIPQTTASTCVGTANWPTYLLVTRTVLVLLILTRYIGKPNTKVRRTFASGFVD